MDRALRLVKTDTGYAIVDRRAGPYSFSDPIDTVVLDVTDEEMAVLDTDRIAADKAEKPTKKGSKT